MARWKDITGEKFGWLTVTSFSHTEKQGAVFNCTCECGNTAVVPGRNLRNGDTRSCGCLKRLCSSNKVKAMVAEHNKKRRVGEFARY